MRKTVAGGSKIPCASIGAPSFGCRQISPAKAELADVYRRWIEYIRSAQRDRATPIQ